MRIDRQPSPESDVFASLDFDGNDESPPQSRVASQDAGGPEAQINIKGAARDIQRFRQIAKRDGLRLIGLLRRATEAYEREARTESV